jgi:glycosyltransferase involved in cell wall biosynthesis
MIVVASHNRIDLLDNMLKTLSSIDLNNNEVLIIDTNSDDEEYKAFFSECAGKYPFMFDRKDYTCWDSGAYIHAYNNYPDKKYIFLQDSVTITNPKLIPMWDNFLDIYDVVPFINFGYGYENSSQKEFSERKLPEDLTLPFDAIFGPIFGVRRETLDKLPKEWLTVIPDNKMDGNGMERRWSLMFHLINASKHYLEYTNFQKDHTIYTSKSNIDKHFFYRL